MATNAMENLDPKTDQKLRSVHNTIDKLKDSKKFIKDFISASQKMHSAALGFSQASKQWGDALQRLATIHTDDIGQALSAIVGRQTAIAEALDGIARSLSLECATPLDSGIDNGARELDTFEKEMKDNRTRLAGDLKKLEAATKKSGKQGDTALIQSMKDFNAKREEIDRFKADQLHTVFLIERRRFGEILSATTKVVASQIEFSRSITAMEADVAGHTQLLSTLESLSEEQVNALQTSSQKAFTSLNTSEGANVTLTGSTNAAIGRNPLSNAYGSPRSSPSSPHQGGGPPPPSSMPPPPGGMPPPPAGMPPPPNFNPGPPSFEPPPPASSGGPPKMPPKMAPPSGPPSGLPPPMASPRPGGPPPMPGGPPPGSNGTLRGTAKAPPPPVPGGGPPSGSASPRPSIPSGPPPPAARGPPPPMGGPPPPMGAPPPPMGAGMGGPPPPPGGGPPPPPPGGAPPPPKAPKASSSKPAAKGKSKGGGGGGKLGGGDPSEGRSDLLSSISGFKGGLKKTVTNDRSGPILKEEKKGPMGRGGPPMF